MPRRKAKKLFEEKLTWSDQLAQHISNFVGNIWFVWIHTVIFLIWIVANVVMGDKGWDPYPFIFLVLVVSLEAIFLSTFVLMAQNRESKENEIRDMLDYDVDVHSAEEIQELKKMLKEVLTEIRNSKDNK